ncbi:hypothetical protein MUU72_03430 [Streptomyces sp. RS10V-4]|uniref:uridine kinase family protein n=1 Tax=Streptomyces rhizoryzae TaxID=2932493 RepID=UPI0020040D98|nr:hypothetical protein [Streptomyces rhizoryzae]MCK7622186.1 hypothetical protein [Streptomyces rhizoryzae]
MTVPLSSRAAGELVAARARAAPHGRPALVALEGPAGAGKTTLAAQRADASGPLGPAAVVHGDGFLRPLPWPDRLAMTPHQGYLRLFAWQRLRDQVLVPLRAGRAARYERYDPAVNGLRPDRPGRVAPAGTVIVAGVLTARPELAACYDVIVFVDTPGEVCLRRLHARGTDARRLAWIRTWQAVERHCFAATAARERAHVTVTR